MKYYLPPLFILLAPLAQAQTARTATNLLLQPELQAEVGLKNGDYLLLGLRGQRFTDARNPQRLGFDERQVRLAYEHFWTPQWSWGATARLVSTYSEEVVPEVLLRHRGAVGPLTFGQRLSVERTVPFDNHYSGGSGPDGRTFVRLRLDLDKVLALSSSAALRPRLSYELAAQLRLQTEAADPPIRTIGYGSLRGEVGVRLSNTIDFTPWFAYQTSYIETLPQYNQQGQQVRGGKVNVVSPTLGLDLRFTLLPTGGTPDRQQLPTQH